MPETLLNRQEMLNEDTQFDVLVMGLGITGLSLVEYFLGQGKSVVVADSRAEPPLLEKLQSLKADVPLHLGPFEWDIVMKAGLIALSPGISNEEAVITAARKNGIEVISDVEIFCQRVTTPIIAITGSNGKSTVATLLSQMLQASGRSVCLAGNIGTPVLEVMNEDVDFYVLELSSFQLEMLSSLNAHVSVVLNISADHMDRYASLQHYTEAKMRIFDGDGKIVVNMDDKATTTMLPSQRQTITFSTERHSGVDFHLAEINDQTWLAYRNEPLLAVSEIKLKGKHNLSNVLACLTLGSAIDLPYSAMLEALKSFSGLPHRCQWVASLNDVDWYNDSKGTNEGASCAAIEGLAENRRMILIAGGDGKGADFSILARTIEQYVATTILIGRDAKRIDTVLPEQSERYFSTSLKAAVYTANKIAEAGDVVLLSPACASTDMFADYQQRGREFCEAVLGLQEVKT